MKKNTTQLTAAVYDRWLYTLGGGEQVAIAYAEALRDFGYSTTLLTHKEVDKVKAEQKMDVNLEDIDIHYLPIMSSKELSEYTAKYDLFINTSYLDYFANHSKQGYLSVFFPGEIVLTPYEFIKRALVIPSFRAFFIYPSRFDGFRYDEYVDGQIYKWLRKRSSIIFNANVSKLKLTLYFKTVSFAVLDSIRFELDGEQLSPSEHRLHHHSNKATYTLHLKNTKNKKLSIILPDLPYADQIALVRLTIPGIRFTLYNFFKRLFPKWEMRLHGGPGVTKRSDLESYKKIITISAFCQKWIRKHWGLPSVVLYPPVNTNQFALAKRKQNIIINIGRFFVTGNNKKQLEMVKVFKQMYQQFDMKDWELHFIGSIEEGSKHQQYFEQCLAEAQEYPIHFHTDIAFDELTNRLSKAKIYWHATGLDEDEEKNPIVFEHFGITTVEAMASGCVPVVINGGGQKEIVTAKSGFLWKNRQEWIEQTRKLIQHPDILKQMSQAAVKRSAYFSRKKFKKRFKNILEIE